MTCEADVARCCYHDLIDDPTDDDKSAFYLRSTQNISYVLSDVPVKAEPNGRFGHATRALATQATAGSLIPPEHWNTKYTVVAKERRAASPSTSHLAGTRHCDPSWQSSATCHGDQRVMTVRLSVYQTGPDWRGMWSARWGNIC